MHDRSGNSISIRPRPLNSVISTLPDRKVINEILERVRKTCIFGSTNSPYNKDKRKLTKNSLALFAFKNCKKDSEGIKKRIFDVVQYYNAVYMAHSLKHSSIESQDKEWRQLYLLGLMLTAQEYISNYGYTNCEGMANLAFIESVLQDVTCTIRLIRFDNSSDSSVEELNTVVLGNWPERGCIILSPWEVDFGENCAWEGDFGKYYTWEGDFKSTMPLFKEGLNRARCLFTITADDVHQDKLYIKDHLQKVNYENWLTSPVRKANLASIRNDFFNSINQAAFFKNEGKKFGDYKNLTMWGSTSKNNCKEVEKIKAKLTEDKVVKSIFSMPRI